MKRSVPLLALALIFVLHARAGADPRGLGGGDLGRRPDPGFLERRGDPLFAFSVADLPDSLALDSAQREALEKLLEDLRPEPRDDRPDRPPREPDDGDSTPQPPSPWGPSPAGGTMLLLRFMVETAEFLRVDQFEGVLAFVAERRGGDLRADPSLLRGEGQLKLSMSRAALPGDTSAALLTSWQALAERTDSLEMVYARHRGEYGPIRLALHRAWAGWRPAAAARLPREEMQRLEARHRAAVETALERELSEREASLDTRAETYRRVLGLKGGKAETVNTLIDQSIGRRRDVLVGLRSGTTPPEAADLENRRAGREAQAEIEGLLDADEARRWRAMMACLDASQDASGSGP